MKTRVTNLEVRMAFLEKTIADLDGVIQELADHVDGISVELKGVRAALSRDVDASADLAEDLPPHW